MNTKCSNCGATYEVADGLNGQHATCEKCGHDFLIGGTAETVPPAAPVVEKVSEQAEPQVPSRSSLFRFLLNNISPKLGEPDKYVVGMFLLRVLRALATVILFLSILAGTCFVIFSLSWIVRKPISYVIECNRERAFLQQKIESGEQEIREIEKVVTEVQPIVAKYKGSVDKLTKEREELKIVLDRIEAQTAKAQKELSDSMKGENAYSYFDSDAEKQRKNEKLSKLKQRIEELNRDRVQINTNISKLSQELKEAKKKSDEAEEHLTYCKRRLTTLKELVESNRKAVSELAFSWSKAYAGIVYLMLEPIIIGLCVFLFGFLEYILVVGGTDISRAVLDVSFNIWQMKSGEKHQ